jgi:hypothetical protein
MYVFPNGEAEIKDYFVTGVSLGGGSTVFKGSYQRDNAYLTRVRTGHATWIALKEDPRLGVGIPIIGCPDYRTLIAKRIEAHHAKQSSSPSSTSSNPLFPASLLHLLNAEDPISTKYESSDPKLNPFIHKRILVLTGSEDTLVPSKYTRPFYDGLNVGEDGAKEMVEQRGAGHEVTEEMIRRTGEWVWKYGLAEQRD